MSVFVHAQGMKTVHAGGGGKKWQNSVHIVVDFPLISKFVLVELTDIMYYSTCTTFAWYNFFQVANVVLSGDPLYMFCTSCEPDIIMPAEMFTLRSLKVSIQTSTQTTFL